jgi:hypothetical protein
MTCNWCRRRFVRFRGDVKTSTPPPNHLDPSTGERCKGANEPCKEANRMKEEEDGARHARMAASAARMRACKVKKEP